jgi:hypothetical protein
MSDIVEEARRTAEWFRQHHGQPQYVGLALFGWGLLVDRLADDVERLRMTPAEREAVEDSARDCRQRADSIMGLPTDIRLAASIQSTTLRGLLARAGGQTSGHDSRVQSRPVPENTPACDAQEPAIQAVTLTDEERESLCECADIEVRELPPPPDTLVDALHDPVGPTSGQRLRSKKLKEGGR